MNALLTLALLSSPVVVSQPPLPAPTQGPELLLPTPPPPVPSVGPKLPVPPPPTSGAKLGKPRIPTIDDFVRDFQPAPGVHEVTILHPISGKPVDLAFRLPEGTPKVKTGLRSVTFEYPRKEVTLMFRLFNRADVKYD